MNGTGFWNYLIVTASNERQAQAYESQVAARRRCGALDDFGTTLVVADPDGRRVGSGGSTLVCLMAVLNRETAQGRDATADAEAILRRLRILIVHAGGDSRRLPAYGPCGKVFVPVPGTADPELGCALFDRQLPVFRGLPAAPDQAGQIVITSGDALIEFDGRAIRFAPRGISALGCLAPAEAASKHGVFCADADGRVRLYLQKPKPEEQAAAGALNEGQQAILDIGVMNLDASAAAALLKTFGIARDREGNWGWSPAMGHRIAERGLDIYREVCCALGREADAAHHLRSARASGSTWDERELRGLFDGLHAVPFFIQVVQQCRFLHFGTTRQIISSGLELIEQDTGRLPDDHRIVLNSAVHEPGLIQGSTCWVEGCRVSARLSLAGSNVVIGVDVTEALELPAEACLDVLRGRDRTGRDAWFVRLYGIRDTFKDALAKATFCGMALPEWIKAAGLTADDLWAQGTAASECSLWNARVFPAEREPQGYRRWLWMLAPGSAGNEQRRAFAAADRYSVAEIAGLADQDDFYARRTRLRTGA